MTGQLNPRELDSLSAFLDGELPTSEQKRIEEQILINPEAHRIYEDLKTIKLVIHSLPVKKPRRNFSLTPSMVEKKFFPLPRLFPVFSMASVLSVFLFVLSIFLGETPIALSGVSPAMMAIPQSEKMIYGTQVSPWEKDTPQIILWGGPANYSIQPNQDGMGGGGNGGGGGGNNIFLSAPQEPLPNVRFAETQPNAKPETLQEDSNPASVPKPEMKAEQNPVPPEVESGTPQLQPQIPAADSMPLSSMPTPSLQPETSSTEDMVTSLPLKSDDLILGVPPIESRGNMQISADYTSKTAPPHPIAQNNNLYLIRAILAVIAIIFGFAATYLWIKFSHEHK